ncbi:ATP-binding protein [Schwartzia succinivorans]|jgi:magnesium chelatase subunit I|uniref:Mg-protoporphyrin IX chelatase n=1 Tax=Schwartzia succinivorans DSM 10502 TaxID=1123243 RepID=A0A1M4Z0X7_9FIRM|nr:AAA family ATPase [Schwartzia succinivorans]MBQ1918319.1 AAA family ATPase [Schwartzia sp. (in: firmicutes)]MBQ3863990.1 AAA family ATPase [Schwartzia sp. (in: firmicutes)]MBQ5413913.1 AAA family ATPase [Schwartzia sp. (in: firmicutes)]MDY6294820.1 AAA family ATPase [Schwartzia succinivorans]SHF11615.1 protoporphyrin IX magnesium-chelatase [Schwartzia succinivorans DSM 10502]
MKRVSTFPFTAIIGQEDMKKALILNVVNPRLGGVLIQGEKGTAKSTTVRALAELLPPRPCIVGCRFHDDPHDKSNWCDECHEKYDNAEPETELLPMRVTELPVSATEDRVVGTLDIEAAIREGKRSFEPGILADANRNILYVDEINLLDDHVVDVLLDSAAMGINTVEREGISYSHPARFSLVGTMNPEEGDIRPQLLDRFALSVYITGEKDLDKRAEVIKRRLEYEDDPEAFNAKWAEEQEKEVHRIERAIKLLPQVTVTNEILRMAAEISITLGVEGHRADITLIKTAETIAAVDGHTEVTKEDLRTAARLALPHRMRRRPFEEQKLDWENVDKVIDA